MGNAATFLFFFLTYVATAMWFHWRGFNLGMDTARDIKEPARKQQ